LDEQIITGKQLLNAGRIGAKLGVDDILAGARGSLVCLQHVACSQVRKNDDI